MSDRKKILIQLDSDPLPSVFDRVVAVDAGADFIFSYGGVRPDTVRDLVYGAIFTRGPDHLNHTAIFIGGSNVALGEEILRAVSKCFFGSHSVSVLFDPNGANTTASAAVVLASRHTKLQGKKALVLGSTGPVGLRAGRLLLRAGAHVIMGSRSLERASEAARQIQSAVNDSRAEAVSTEGEPKLLKALEGVEVVVSAGGPGVCLLPSPVRSQAKSLRVAIDLNAVPPQGIEGIKASESGKEHEGVVTYGALGVGGLKMKIHKAALGLLFEKNSQVLDADEVFAIGSGL